MERGINNDIIVAVLVGHIVSDKHLVAVQDSGESEGIGSAEGQAEVGAVARDLPEVHATKAQRLSCSHHLGDLGNLLIDYTVRIEEVLTWGNLVEHSLTDI